MSFSRHQLVTICIALTLNLSAGYSHADDLFDMLKRMSDADINKNYQGTFILRKSDSLTTLRVTHGVNNKGEWESLESLNGEPRHMYRIHDRVISVFPERNLLTVRHTDEKQVLHQRLPDNIDQLARFYSMKRLDDDRIARHQTLVVDLLPRDQFRYGYRYWVDKNTGMLLRCDLIDEENNVVEQMMFTSLEYLSDVPEQPFNIDQFGHFQQQSLDEREEKLAQVTDSEWKVGHLPNGFMLTQSIQRPMRSTSAAVPDKSAGDASGTVESSLLHLVYSDGLASVSVFVEEYQGEGRHLQGEASMGAMNAYGNTVDGYVVTVVGEVPAKTVQLMAQTMVRQSKSRQSDD